MTSLKPSIVIYLPDLSGGGAERLQIGLASRFLAQGFHVIFLLDRRAGPLLDQVPEGCEVVILEARRQLAALPRLTAFLRRRRPDVLVANTEHMNVMAVLASILSGAPTRIVVIQHNTLSEQAKVGGFKHRILPLLYRLILPHAAGVVAVSRGVADDMAALTGAPRERMRVIYNGVVDETAPRRAAAPVGHPWFAEDRPVVVGMGRFVPQKDFHTLIRAFALVAERTDARLVLLGDGPDRPALEALAAELNLSDRIAMPGFIADPLPYLARAGTFVLSSRYEGFGNVLVEALACGAPVVSTRCPHGPEEILENGRYGALVPPGDWRAMGEAIVASLAATPDRDDLIRRGASFSIAACAEEYATLFAELSAVPSPPDGA